MGRYEKGDHVKIEVWNESSSESEWMRLLVESRNDSEELVVGKPNSQPIVHTDVKLGQQLAVSDDNIREHRRFA